MASTIAPEKFASWSSRRRRVIGAAVAMATALAIPAATGVGATAADGFTKPAKDTAKALYIVQVNGNPIASYAGDSRGNGRTKPRAGERVDASTAAAAARKGALRKAQADVLRRQGIATSAKKAEYTVAFNGFAASLTPSQAAAVTTDAGVARVWRDERRYADTISTPDMLKLTGGGGLWKQKFGGPTNAGLGMIVGIIDSGFWPENPSLAALPEPRPDAAKITRKWRGVCDPGVSDPITCNNKVLGARYYTAGATIEDFEFVSPRDFHSHGTHVGTTAAGNHDVQASINGGVVGRVSGMAPAARLSFYKALWATPDGRATGSTADLVMAIDDAVADGVDVINYSISGSSQYVVTPDEVAFLNAADAGVFIATSAGNSGDTVGVSSVAHNSPWTMTVAASTHDRGVGKTLTLGDGSTYEGVGVGPSVGPTVIVDAADSALAGADPVLAGLCYDDADQDPANGVQAVLDPAKVADRIVVCARGTIDRVAKSAAVKAAGGVGMVLKNTAASQSLNADFHSVPSIHVGAADGAAITAYVDGTAAATAAISGVDATPAQAPSMAGFSSFGPALAGGGDLLKPDVTAPGVDVIAGVSPASNDGNDYNAFSGTSMSAPHVAGLATLLAQAHPSWSPMAVKSALMTTATKYDNTGGVIQRAGRDATPLDYGAGHVRPKTALRPGLVYDSGVLDWLQYGCGIEQIQLITSAAFCQSVGAIDPSDLNYPSISVGDLPGRQTVTRTVTNVENRTATYSAQVTPPPGFRVSVSPSSFTIAPGESASFTVTMTRTTAAVGEWAFGQLSWRGDKGQAVRSPIAVRGVGISVPAVLSGTGSSGSTSPPVTVGYDGTLTTTLVGLAPAVTTTIPVTLDVDVQMTVDVPAGAQVARFATYDVDYPSGTDIDIYVLKDGALVGQSAGGSSEEAVTLTDPDAGEYVVVVDLFAGPGSLDALVHTFVVDGAEGNASVSPASQPVTAGDTPTVTVEWSGLTADRRYLGQVSYGDGSGEIATSLLTVIVGAG